MIIYAELTVVDDLYAQLIVIDDRICRSKLFEERHALVGMQTFLQGHAAGLQPFIARDFCSCFPTRSIRLTWCMGHRRKAQGVRQRWK